MGVIDDIKAAALAKLPDNNAELIKPVHVREVVDTIADSFAALMPLYLRVNLGGVKTFQNAALKVPTNRLMIVSGGTVVSNNPVNDDGDPNPANWPYPGGSTPTSWSHDPATGDLWLPVNTTILEITIRPVL